MVRILSLICPTAEADNVPGIGEALARKLVDDGSVVIAVGRRKENLDKLVQEYGHDKVQGIQFDITQLKSIPHFATNIINTHPDLDCIILNAGIQRRSDFSDPDTVDIDVLELEFRTNYLSQLALTKAFLPHFQKKDGQSALIYVTSGLALVPIVRCPNYCAAKAGLHQFILCLREQLKGSRTKVVELFPPAVQTELHDGKHQPDIKNGRAIGMPLDEFTNQVCLKSNWLRPCEAHIVCRRMLDWPVDLSRCPLGRRSRHLTLSKSNGRRSLHKWCKRCAGCDRPRQLVLTSLIQLDTSLADCVTFSHHASLATSNSNLAGAICQALDVGTRYLTNDGIQGLCPPTASGPC